MIDLYLHQHKTDSIFDLLGTKENDISFAAGLVFSKSENFLKLFLKTIGITAKFDPSKIQIRLQQYEREKGFTDFEIEQDGEFSIIVEAKKGWNYPSQHQLDKYSSKPSFHSFAGQKKLVVFTESSKDFTNSHFHITTSNNYEVVVVSYKELWVLGQKAKAGSNNYQKRFLIEFITYFEKIMTMQNIFSNKVFVVAINHETEKNWNISWIDIVKKRKYFHPVGCKGWPKEPPNYIAFRYAGKLQAIHHVDSYIVFKDPGKHFKEIPSQKWENHFLYNLGEPIMPSKEIRTGNIFRNGRVWAMLDLLLTSNTISEARDKTKLRQEQIHSN